VPPDGRYPVSVLAAKNEYLTCVVTALPAGGQYRLEAVADERRTLTEYDESNNVYEQAYTAPAGPVAATEPGPTPSPEQADLNIASIKVNGQAPDGKDDCKAGKNEVKVVVKNGGATTADTIAVRLTVDGVQVGTKSVAQLDAGDELELRFDDVRLKKGEHKLAATTDLKGSAADSTQENDWVKVTVRCQDGG
jgi:subtilase family serine protease